MKTRKLLLLLLFVLFLSSCGAADMSEPAGDYGDDYNDVDTDPEPPAPVIDDADLDGGDVVHSSEVPALEDRKIIYTADLTMNAPEPEEVYNDVLDILDTYSAYVESANINSNRYTIKLRVLTENFTDFIEEIKTSGDMVSFSKTSEDVTNAYSTFEIRYAALQARHDRILTLIEGATSLQTILDLEEERYEIEVELNQIGEALGSIDSLIDFSTVNLVINRTVDAEVILPKTDTPYVSVSEITKHTTRVEVSNNNDQSVNIYLDLLVNGEFVRQYEGEAFEDGTAVFELGELKSNTEYQLRISTIAAEHRESNVVRKEFTTESTFFNKVGNVFVGSFDVLMLILEYTGLAVVAVAPFAIAGAIVFVPSRIVYTKYLQTPLSTRKVRKQKEREDRLARMEARRQEYMRRQQRPQQRPPHQKPSKGPETREEKK
jgi:hypothetical protein